MKRNSTEQNKTNQFSPSNRIQGAKETKRKTNEIYLNKASKWVYRWCK